MQQAGWRFDVNTKTRLVRVTPPQVKVHAPGRAAAPTSSAGADFSLVGADAIGLVIMPGTFRATDVGAGGASPGKVLVSFAVQIVNLLSGVDLVTPTFPVPPESGIFLFPFATNVTTTSGGANGSGNDVIVDLPNTGQVAPSLDFAGAPYNWFNDTGCAAGANDCVRYEVFRDPLPGGAVSEGQTIGFEVDPTVSTFSAKMIVAADLHNAVLTGVNGRVLVSYVPSQWGPGFSGATLGGVTVAVAGGPSTVSDFIGQFSFPSLASGTHTFALVAGLLAGCTSSPETVAVPSLGVFVTLTAVCPDRGRGTVTGTVGFAAGSTTPSLAATSVDIVPENFGTFLGASLNTQGTYTRADIFVATGAGTVIVRNVPFGCTAPAAVPYSGLTSGSTVTVPPITLSCPNYGSNYRFAITFSPIAAGRTTMTATIDMTTRNDPANNGTGLDQLGAFQAIVTYPVSRLSNPSCHAGQLAGAITLGTPGQIGALLGNTGATGVLTLFSCGFAVAGTGPTPVGLFGALFADPSAHDVTPWVDISLEDIP